MPIVKEQVATTLSPAAAFDYVANLETIEEWDPGVVSSRKLTEGPLAVGSTYEIVVQYGGAPQAMTYTVTEVSRPSLVVLEGNGARAFAVDRISFVESDTGTAIDYEADIRLKGVFRAAEPFLGKLFARVGEGARTGLDSRLRELADADAEQR
jgi:hypothetical protein